MSIPAKRAARGYSLLEAIIALAIVAGLASLAAASLARPPGGAAVRSEAREIASGLARVRAHAISTGQITDYRLDLSGRVQTILDARRALRKDIDIRATVAESQRRGNGAVGVRFFPNGSSSGGAITLSAGAAEASVEVDWMTGRIRIEEASVAS